MAEEAGGPSIVSILALMVAFGAAVNTAWNSRKLDRIRRNEIARSDFDIRFRNKLVTSADALVEHGAELKRLSRESGDITSELERLNLACATQLQNIEDTLLRADESQIINSGRWINVLDHLDDRAYSYFEYAISLSSSRQLPDPVLKDAVTKTAVAVRALAARIDRKLDFMLAAFTR